MQIGTLSIEPKPFDEMFDVSAVFARLTPGEPVADFGVDHERERFAAQLVDAFVEEMIFLSGRGSHGSWHQLIG